MMLRQLILLSLLLLGAWLHVDRAAAQNNEVLVLEISGPVTPTMGNYFSRGIAEAEARGSTAVLIKLNTPGGAVNATQEIVQIFRGAPVPVIVYVSPRGAQAASAGSIITVAAHAAGMAPETVIGAASPVGGGGEELDETISRKIIEDLKATVRNLTERRGEEAVALAEAMIEEARAVTAKEALAAGLIDAVANDVDDLLQQLDGLTIMIDDQPLVLETADAVQRPLPLNFIEQLLNLLVNPIIIGILLTIGVQAILIELSSPGGWVAGLVGVLALVIALYGLGQLPVNWLGLGLIVVAFVLFIMEVTSGAQGALAITGTVVLIAGLLVLFNSPGSPDFVRLSIPAAIGIGVTTAAFFTFIVRMALRAQRLQPSTGTEGLVGRTGEVRTALTTREGTAVYKGMVLIAGELWRAEAKAPIQAGQTVIVKAVDGFTLHVEEQGE
jgi:membrane-bound serine protease (ClpP class)